VGFDAIFALKIVGMMIIVIQKIMPTKKDRTENI